MNLKRGCVFASCICMRMHGCMEGEKPARLKVLGPVRHYKIPATPQTFARIHTQLPCSATSLTNTQTLCAAASSKSCASARGKQGKREKRKEEREKRVVGVRS